MPFHLSTINFSNFYVFLRAKIHFKFYSTIFSFLELLVKNKLSKDTTNLFYCIIYFSVFMLWYNIHSVKQSCKTKEKTHIRINVIQNNNILQGIIFRAQPTKMLCSNWSPLIVLSVFRLVSDIKSKPRQSLHMTRQIDDLVETEGIHLLEFLIHTALKNFLETCMYQV